MNYHAPNLPRDKHCFFNRETDYKNHPPANLVALNQRHHTNTAIYADHPQIEEVYADGVITKDPTLLLSVRTADCTPILFADYKHGIIGAAHSGWKGALRGIIESTLDLMLQHGAVKEDIAAAIGPHMHQKSFDAKQDMYDMFIQQDKKFAQYFTPKGDNYLFDMTAFVLDKLKNYGIKDISISNINTYDSPNHNSYRRSCHEGTPYAISQYSVIRL